MNRINLLIDHSFLITETAPPKPKRLRDMTYNMRRSIESELKRQNPHVLNQPGLVFALTDKVNPMLAKNGVRYWKRLAEDCPIVEI